MFDLTDGELLRTREDVRHLRLDCARLDMVDSMGLTVLLRIHRDACERGVTLHLDDTGPVLRRLLHLTGAYEHLTTVPEHPNVSDSTMSP
ncbi:STAS domain-containing protein [Streptomyces sp. NPDC002328]|uniref:STAS domain-containing protein n=1 Tax=Streptomyces sp. NPDC002328 TaxID=3364642 RepID=UPI00367D8A7D